MTHLNDTSDAINLIWEALDDWHDNYEDLPYIMRKELEERWESICEAMATISDELGIQHTRVYPFKDNWQIVPTGGGCTALRLQLDGYFLLACEPEGACVPETGDGVSVGLYIDDLDADGSEALNWWFDFKDEATMIRDIDHLVINARDFVNVNNRLAERKQ